MPPSYETCLCAWYSQVGVEQGPSNLGNKMRGRFLGFLVSHEGTGCRAFEMPDKTSPNPGRGRERGVCHWVGTSLSPSFLFSAVRSNLIPSPPTYNLAHDYISWESFSNVSYYTRILPSVPKDCPKPMGAKGKGVRGAG